jgi:hypothetical protein
VVRALVLALLVAGCGESFDNSTTCGRGRCVAGATCKSVFGDGRQNQGWQEPHYPNVLDEWWCERDCPAGVTCDGQCLQDPADTDTVVCEAPTVDVIYYSNGSSCLCDSSHHCEAAQPVGAIDVLDTCATQHNTLATCLSKQDCAAGTFSVGDTVPGVRLYAPALGTELIYCPGHPTNTFVGPLPAGRTLRVYVDEDVCL